MRSADHEDVANVYGRQSQQTFGRTQSKTQRGLDILKRLVAKADLFVQNFRPGVAEQMGIGEAELRRIKPDLVYVSISGFGETGPYVHKRVYDPVIQALSGLASIQADPDGRPHMMRLSCRTKSPP